MAHSTVDLHLKEISEFLHGSVINKRLLHIRPIGPIASESVCMMEQRYVTPYYHLCSALPPFHHAYMHFYCYLAGGSAYLLDRGKEWCNSVLVTLKSYLIYHAHGHAYSNQMLDVISYYG